MTATNLTWTLLEGQNWTLSASPFFPSSHVPKAPQPPTLSEDPSNLSLFSEGQNTQMYYASSVVRPSRSLREDRSRIHWLNHRSINSYQR